MLWSILPDLENSKIIPKGTKILLRWDGEKIKKDFKQHNHRHHKINKKEKQQRRPSISANYASTSKYYSLHVSNKLENNFRSRTALNRSPSSFLSSSELTKTTESNNLKDHLIPSGLLLFSFCGFLLILLIIIFLLRIFRSSDNELKNSASSRELQIILLPKNRLNKNNLENEELKKEEQKDLLNQPNIGRKLFPKRIYELQAEEGYFSCPPSMRTSFEAD